jgi:hypothetical protein
MKTAYHRLMSAVKSYTTAEGCSQDNINVLGSRGTSILTGQNISIMEESDVLRTSTQIRTSASIFREPT